MKRGRSSKRYRNGTLKDLEFHSGPEFYVKAKCLINSLDGKFPLRNSVFRKHKRSHKFPPKGETYRGFKGVGKKLNSLLEKKFEDPEALSRASVDEILEIKGMSKRLAESLYSGMKNSEHYWIEGNRRFSTFEEEYPEGKNAIQGYPSGRFLTWLYTHEIREALKDKCIEEVFDYFVTDRIDKKYRSAWRLTRKKALEHYGRKCLRCGAANQKMVIDHILPMSVGGTDDLQNLQVLCKECHHWKTRKEQEGGYSVFLDYDNLDFRP